MGEVGYLHPSSLQTDGPAARGTPEVLAGKMPAGLDPDAVPIQRHKHD